MIELRDIGDLRQRQALPLGAKVLMSQNRIREWYEHFDGNVCVSFSGGKDSTVLAHLVRDVYPDVPLVFSNTGLEYPEIQAFARKMGAEFVTPKMNFSEVISKYGYPIISKENAEAIYYARRIRNNEGGVQAHNQETLGISRTTKQKRLELLGKRKITGGVQRNNQKTNRPCNDSIRRNLLTGGNGRINRTGVNGKDGGETALPG